MKNVMINNILVSNPDQWGFTFKSNINSLRRFVDIFDFLYGKISSNDILLITELENSQKNGTPIRITITEPSFSISIDDMIVNVLDMNSKYVEIIKMINKSES